jgi:Zn finger protein HypA/HybF involved in hydrogenase expression
MIRLEAAAILVLFVAVPLVTTALLALCYSMRGLHRPVRSQESIYKCVHCGHVYVIARNRPMDRCPRCGTLNDAVRT